jgi:hypothetical protein
LRALVERPRAVVSKAALIEVVWPNQAVEERNVTVQIAALRWALGRTPGSDRWIRDHAPTATASSGRSPSKLVDSSAKMIVDHRITPLSREER